MNGPDPDAGRRAEAMARRLARTTRRAGLDEAGATLVEAAYRAALAPRLRRLPDAHHPDLLHPARTVLILLEDLGVTDPEVLAAGALCETLRPELAAPGAAAALGHPRVAGLLAEVPVPDEAGEALLERLLVAGPDARAIALAERLDHARHLHLRPAPERAPLHARTCGIYLPVADRTHPTLARRYRWWCSTFARRFLP